MNNNHNKFTQQAITTQDQLELLASRGMIIGDKKLAEHYLTFISYYRFCEYALHYEIPLPTTTKKYQDITFEQVLDCYIFDRKLRLLVMDAIERIEVAIRTVLNNNLSLKYGAHWYLDHRLFLKKYNHKDLIDSIERETSFKAHKNSSKSKKREHFIQRYFDKYTDPNLPASWMIAEILSLGSWSMIFANLINRDDQKAVCEPFKLNYKVMESWLHSLTYLRNVCAHHSRLWNRQFTLKPLIANEYRDQLENNSKLSAQASILKLFLDVISPGHHWSRQLIMLVNEHPYIKVSEMGFSKRWDKDPFWT